MTEGGIDGADTEAATGDRLAGVQRMVEICEQNGYGWCLWPYGDWADGFSTYGAQVKTRTVYPLITGTIHWPTVCIGLYKFLQAVRNRTAPEIDVYDTASWSVIIPLSIASVSQGSAPIEFPDFTRGKWKSRLPLPVVSD